MQILELTYQSGHLFTQLNGAKWLIDTGSPATFGTTSQIRLGDQEFFAASEYMGLNAESLSGSLKLECSGLIGTDVLNQFDWIIDIENESLVFDVANLSLDGETLPTRMLMGVPIVTVHVGDEQHDMFFDTGAQVSYLQSDSLGSFPDAGAMTDFYPSFGEFDTPTHNVPMVFRNTNFTLRCGRLPSVLAVTLLAAGTTGIVGNEVFLQRKIGYFPRRKLLVIGS